MIELNNTGERILLEKETPLMIARHFSAYKFCRDYVKDNNILDIGCGQGYGCNYLAGFARQVTGIDYNQEVIDYARDKYRNNNLTFEALNVKDFACLKKQFDIICSFQVIEHIADAARLLSDISSLLNYNGTFICSTPNRLDASPGSIKPLNKFHIKEYLLTEFRGLLKTSFKDVKIFGLKRGKRLNFYRRLKKIGAFNFLPSSINPVQRFYESIDSDDFIIVKDKLDTALDFIAVCKK